MSHTIDHPNQPLSTTKPVLALRAKCIPLAIVAALSILTGCAVGPVYERPIAAQP